MARFFFFFWLSLLDEHYISGNWPLDSDILPIEMATVKDGYLSRLFAIGRHVLVE